MLKMPDPSEFLARIWFLRIQRLPTFLRQNIRVQNIGFYPGIQLPYQVILTLKFGEKNWLAFKLFGSWQSGGDPGRNVTGSRPARGWTEKFLDFFTSGSTPI